MQAVRARRILPGGRGGTPGFESIVPACEPPETKFMVEVVSGTPTAACYTDPMSWACLRPKLDIEHSCDAK